jgi:excisionase family DNA binding protein
MTAVRKLSELTEDEFRALIREELGQQTPAETYVDSEAIQKYFGISRATVHNWVHEDGCPHEKRGKILRFKLSAVESWFAGRNKPLKRVR